MTSNKYGPAVLGDEAYEQQLEVVRSGVDKYGPAVLDHPGVKKAKRAKKADEPETVLNLTTLLKTTPEPTADPTYVPTEPVTITRADVDNLQKFEAVLGGDVGKVVPLFEFELLREEGPRKGALQALREVEAGSDQPRPDVLSMIDDQLEKLEKE